MENRKVKNPLTKRIPRELRDDWKKYLVVSLFLILTIGFVSGMYVANGSMMKAADEGSTKYRLEDGHFELGQEADEALLTAVRAGKQADIKQYYLDQAQKELDEKFQGEFDRKFAEAYQEGYQESSDEIYQKAYQKAYEEAWTDLQKEVDEEYADAEDKYELDNPDVQAVPVKVFENFFRNEEEDNDRDGTADGTIRVYAETEEVNLACLMEGRFPETEAEIAIDRMHADNAGIKTGDTILVGNQQYQVVGLLAYVNYSTLHEKSTDFMFDALKFDVAMVTEKGFGRLNSDIHFTYAWKYEKKPADEKEEKKFSDVFLKALLTQAVVHEQEIEEYMPAYANPAIHFATDDMGGDEAMGGVLLDILIVIIAFIFAVTVSSTIAKEASAIGTLRALGYSKGELVRHYLSMPVIVALLAAAVGNLLGYSVFKNVVVSMYYNSYSLPVYVTIWNPEAFFKTTLIPVVLMLAVNLVVIARMLQHTPLQFLRHDLKKTKRKKAMRLPGWKFFSRFRIRIILQNIPNYMILVLGILFIATMLAMAVGMPDTLAYYKEHAKDMMLARYQYMMKSFEDDEGNSIGTDNPDAEKFAVHSLEKRSDVLDEEISVYGIEAGSSYVKIDGFGRLAGQQAFVSRSFAEKYDLKTGSSVTLDEKYENSSYRFEVAGIYEQCQTLAVFLPIRNYWAVLGQEEGTYSGYLSNAQLADLDEDNIATVITERDITKMCDQLDHSMGAYMQYFQVLCVLLSAVLIYLLTKLIIEKNEKAISMTKILGYEDGEIAGLYLLSTTMILVAADVLCVGLGALVMNMAWKAIMAKYNGWFTFMTTPLGYVKMFIFILAGYLLVMVIDFRRIRRIPMDEALKGAE